MTRMTCLSLSKMVQCHEKMKFLYHGDELNLRAHSPRFIFMSEKRVISPRAENPEQGKNGAEWSGETQKKLSAELKKNVQTELTELKKTAESATEKDLVLEVKRGDTLYALVKALDSSATLDRVVKYQSAKLKDKVAAWNEAQTMYKVDSNLDTASATNGVEIPLREAHFIVPGQYVWIEADGKIVVSDSVPGKAIKIRGGGADPDPGARPEVKPVVVNPDPGLKTGVGGAGADPDPGARPEANPDFGAKTDSFLEKNFSDASERQRMRNFITKIIDVIQRKPNAISTPFEIKNDMVIYVIDPPVNGNGTIIIKEIKTLKKEFPSLKVKDFIRFLNDLKFWKMPNL